jgi:hypothetical protein
MRSKNGVSVLDLHRSFCSILNSAAAVLLAVAPISLQIAGQGGSVLIYVGLPMFRFLNKTLSSPRFPYQEHFIRSCTPNSSDGKYLDLVLLFGWTLDGR